MLYHDKIRDSMIFFCKAIECMNLDLSNEQLSCCSMCKIVTWLDNKMKIECKMDFRQI